MIIGINFHQYCSLRVIFPLEAKIAAVELFVYLSEQSGHSKEKIFLYFENYFSN